MDVLTPVIDISDDDDDPTDLTEADDECRYSVSRRAGLSYVLFNCMLEYTKKNDFFKKKMHVNSHVLGFVGLNSLTNCLF